MAMQCQAKTKRGRPCAATALPGEAYCRWHHPDLDEQRRAWSAEGGKNRANARRAAKELQGDSADPTEVTAVLSRAFRKLEAGEMEPGVATALASIGKTLVMIIKESALEARVRELESSAGVIFLDDHRRA